MRTLCIKGNQINITWNACDPHGRRKYPYTSVFGIMYPRQKNAALFGQCGTKPQRDACVHPDIYWHRKLISTGGSHWLFEKAVQGEMSKPCTEEHALYVLRWKNPVNL